MKAPLLFLPLVVTASPIWDFVNKPDPEFTWFDTNYTISSKGLNVTEKGWDAYLLNVTSGSWLTPAETTCHLWSHQVLVVIPWELNPNLDHDNAALWITGGGNGDGPPKWDSEDVGAAASMATKTGCVAAAIFQVPNENCYFTADPKHDARGEDNIIAFTWMQFLLVNQSRPDWIVFFPMARACSRAMDAVTQFVQKKMNDPTYTLGNWFTFGASKRGWTTWWTAIVDSRVKAIAPIVMDLLNFLPTIDHMWRSLGNWTFAFEPYLSEGVPSLFGTPTLNPLLPLVDPLLNAENLTLPKLVIDATGDEFFLIQDDYTWWGSLPGETYRYIESNAEHSQATAVLRLIESCEAFWLSILTNTPRPQMNWTLDLVNGAITAEVTGALQPNKMSVTSATTLPGSCKEGVVPCVPRRDFRLIVGDTEWNPCHYIKVNVFGQACLRPIVWVGENIAPVASNATYSKWIATQEFPPEGFWRGFMIEAFFDGPAGTNSTFKMTTQVAIIPDTYPFDTCVGEDCMKSLV
jgi:PhoPQ-activated pathogenicity-related protein